ncbi:MAG: MerR family transcriptional regulator [Planctomycetota bacterium]|nr:MerR family transcriptional regulator [Planctomycetota bacterium]MDP6501968.1 MerR family transcriptional regulator [Planctomycetota bacterium]
MPKPLALTVTQLKGKNMQYHGEHLLSIKEASRLSGVPAYTLRFWEKEFIDFLKPPRTEGGQRRYDQESLEMVERIKHLVDEEKYSIAGARGVLAMERQQAEQRDDIGTRLRNEEQINLILDEIANIVREKVVSRLLRDENFNQIIGDKVAGLKPEDLINNQPKPENEHRPTPDSVENVPSQPRFKVQADSPSSLPGISSNIPRVTIRDPLKNLV